RDTDIEKRGTQVCLAGFLDVVIAERDKNFELAGQTLSGQSQKTAPSLRVFTNNFNDRTKLLKHRGEAPML
ncbi:MAG TPA: hypothetical protein DEV64_00935, partial [Rhodospirillaceae bacterium]|nr:hypothetical protein [Rhodospirillaceae bacterium]